MITAVCILNRTGDLLAIRRYLNDFDKNALEDYRISVIAANELKSPATLINHISFLHVYHNEVYYVAMTRKNANAALIFEFLERLPEIFQTILGLPEVNQNQIKLNAPEIIELLDEMVDAGYPQATDIEILRLLTHSKPPSVKSAINNQQVTIAATGAITWRPPNIRHKVNEVLVDVGEKVSTLISSTGKILDSVVDGSIILKVHLSGMPECKIGFNDKVSMDSEQKKQDVPFVGTTTAVDVDDMVFHQCVRLSNFAKDRAITFIPPDGEFELMRYRKTNNIKIPFSITPMVREVGVGQTEVKVVVKSEFNSNLMAHPFILAIPMPSNTSKVKIVAPTGDAKYVMSKNSVLWRVGHFPGAAQYEISCLVHCLASVKKDASTKLTEPISAEFSIVMFSATGLSLRYMTIVEKSNYHIDRYIRYRTRAGKFEVRMI